MSINGTNAPIINSVGGSVSGSELTISVNGINSSPITLPSGGRGGITVTEVNSVNDIVSIAYANAQSNIPTILNVSIEGSDDYGYPNVFGIINPKITAIVQSQTAYIGGCCGYWRNDADRIFYPLKGIAVNASQLFILSNNSNNSTDFTNASLISTQCIVQGFVISLLS